MKNRGWLCLSALILPLPTLAADMATLFPYAAQSHDQGGEVEMDEGAWIKGTENQSGFLNFKNSNDTDNSASNLEGLCDNKTCQLSYELGEALPLDKFQSNAKELVVEEGEVKVLPPGDNWFTEVDIKQGAQLKVSDDATLYIKEKLQLEKQASLGSLEFPINVVVYDDGDVELDENAEVYGFIYVNGELKLGEDSGVYGAVNVVDLEMDERSFIDNTPYLKSTGVHHYQLSYNTDEDKLTAFACGDYACSQARYYSGEVKRLHIKDGINNNEISNFKDFTHTAFDSSPNIKPDSNGCFQFTIQNSNNNTQGAKPWPESEPALRCFVDGDEAIDCKVCSEQTVTSSLAAYVYGDITLSDESLGVSIPNYSFSINEIESAGELIRTSDGEALVEGSSVDFPLTLTSDHAGKIALSIKGDNDKKNKKNKNKQEVEFQLELTFVPKAMRWVAAGKCVDETGFDYLTHNANCNILAKAGEKVTLSLQAYGENEQVIDSYEANLEGIEVRELDATKQQTSVLYQNTFPFSQQASSELTTSQAFDAVALIQAYVPEHCAPYAVKDEKCLLKTSDDTAIIGRTVPASLKVTPTAGDIAGDVVYAGQLGVSFDTEPSFTVVGLDINGNQLSSFSGEFAGGLKDNASLVIDTSIDHALLEWDINEQVNGEHVFSLDDDKLSFIKDLPFPEARLNLPLKLSIGDHDGTQGVDANTTLAQEDDTLRFGFVTLMDTEIKVGEAGSMASKLHYFGENTQTVLEDDRSGYSLSGEGRLSYEPALNPELQLALADRDVTVEPYDKQEKNIEVTVENLPAWLKPEQDGSLTNPVALLDILNNLRLRASDSTFNRREVIR